MIEWWVVIKDRKIETIRKALSLWTYIYTGSNNRQRPSRLKSPYKIKRRFDWRIVWHAFCIVEDLPEQECLKACNSFWPKWWDKWYFLIPYEYIPDLFTLYAIVDKNDSNYFKIIRQKEKAKQFIALAKELYYNWDQEIKKFFEDIQLSIFINSKYWL